MGHSKSADLMVTEFSISVYFAALFMNIGILSRTLKLRKRTRIMTKSQSSDVLYSQHRQHNDRGRCSYSAITWESSRRLPRCTTYFTLSSPEPSVLGVHKHRESRLSTILYLNLSKIYLSHHNASILESKRDEYLPRARK